MKLGLRHAALECSSLKRSIDFYVGVLGFKVYWDKDADWAMLSLGDTYLSLVPVREVQKSEKRGSHQAHLGFLFPNKGEVLELAEKLRADGRWVVGACKEHRDGSFGFYLNDPDGNSLECIFIPHRPVADMPKSEAWLLLAHGSSDPDWALPFMSLVEDVRAHAPGVEVRLCFMGSAAPSLEDSLQMLALEAKVQRVLVFPVFLSSGGVHMRKDVPDLIEAARKKFPQFRIEGRQTLGEHFLVRQAMSAAILRLSE